MPVTLGVAHQDQIQWVQGALKNHLFFEGRFFQECRGVPILYGIVLEYERHTQGSSCKLPSVLLLSRKPL